MLLHEIKINQPFDWFCRFFFNMLIKFPFIFQFLWKVSIFAWLGKMRYPRWRAGKAQVNETLLAAPSILSFSLFLSSSSSLPCHFPSAVFFCTFITFTYFSFHYLFYLFFFLFNLPPYPLSLAVHWISLLITDLTVADEFSARGADS